MNRTRIALILIAASLAFCGCQAPVAWLRYPPARLDSIVDTYHGVAVADPYRWLENADSNETLEWVNRENKLTSDFLATPAREKIKQRLTNLWNYPRYSSPSKRANRYFFRKNDGLQNQSVQYFQNSLTGVPTVLINPNLLSPDGTVSLGSTAVSFDGTLFTYGLSQSGSDMQKVKIRNIDTLADYNDVLEWCRWPSIAIKHDNSGLFYDRYPQPNSVSPEEHFINNRVYFHKLQTPQADDNLIYEEPENKEFGFDPFITEDGRFLFLHVWHGTDPNNRIYYRSVESNEPLISSRTPGAYSTFIPTSTHRGAALSLSTSTTPLATTGVKLSPSLPIQSTMYPVSITSSSSHI
jgi:prolyl oligopeptidase